MGGKTPETCWAVNKRQDNKLENCCIWLVIYLNCTMMHGLTNLKFYCTAIPVLFNTVPARVEAFIASYNELLYSLLMEVPVLWYQPSFHNCFHLVIIFKFSAAKIFSVLETDSNRLAKNSPDIINHYYCSIISYKIISYRLDSTGAVPTTCMFSRFNAIYLNPTAQPVSFPVHIWNSLTQYKKAKTLS
jgi:hypothetical protein